MKDRCSLVFPEMDTQCSSALNTILCLCSRRLDSGKTKRVVRDDDEGIQVLQICSGSESGWSDLFERCLWLSRLDNFWITMFDNKLHL